MLSEFTTETALRVKAGSELLFVGVDIKVLHLSLCYHGEWSQTAGRSWQASFTPPSPPIPPLLALKDPADDSPDQVSLRSTVCAVVVSQHFIVATVFYASANDGVLPDRSCRSEAISPAQRKSHWQLRVLRGRQMSQLWVPRPGERWRSQDCHKKHPVTSWRSDHKGVNY